MSQEKYIGIDVHQATISVTVMDAGGKVIMECLLETKAATMVEFMEGLHGTLRKSAICSDISEPARMAYRSGVCGETSTSPRANVEFSYRITDRSVPVVCKPDSPGYRPHPRHWHALAERVGPLPGKSL